MLARTTSVLREELGASIIEYALVLGLIAVTCLFGTTLLGSTGKAQLNSAAGSISAAIAPSTGGTGTGDTGGGSENGNGGGDSGRGNHS